jgi:RNA polymerase sigma-70 factor (ECF subfamily)
VAGAPRLRGAAFRDAMWLTRGTMPGLPGSLAEDEVEAAREISMSNFREDVAALVPHLRAFARSLTGGDVQLADDIVQDTIVNALQAQHQFTPGTNLKAWLFTILRNRFRSVIARKHITAEVSDDDLERHSWTPAEQESRIEVAAFKRAFRVLSVAHREVLVLVAVHGLPYEQVAAICGCEVGTVKSRVNRARAMLKRMLLEDALPVDPQKLPAADRAGRLKALDDTETAAAARTTALGSGLAEPSTAARLRRSLN